jgi:Zn-dependent protease with chaperone function
MSFSLRVVLVGAAAFAAIGLAVAIVVPFIASRLAVGAPRRRAHRLAVLRLIPAAAAAAAGLLAVASFLDFEPRQDEYIGWMIPAIGLLGACLIAGAIVRCARVALATRRLTRDWLARGEPITLHGITVPALAITSDFPVVAVVGLRRPTLVIARSVLEACTPEELEAVLAHEQGHIDRHDNLRRLLMYAAPDALTWLPFPLRLETAWRAATEEAADDEAARTGDEGRVALASALLKVARLATGPRPAGFTPASALYCGENLDGRVRRLLQPFEGAGLSQPQRRRIRTAAALICLIAVSAVALRAVQALIELTIQTLP